MLVFYAFAGHGMQVDGEQVLLINQLNTKKGFYEWWAAEYDIRRLAKKFPNTYLVAIFACCREIFRPATHCGLVGGPRDKAYELYKKQVTIKLQTERAEDDKAKEKASRRRMNSKLKSSSKLKRAKWKESKPSVSLIINLELMKSKMAFNQKSALTYSNSPLSYSRPSIPLDLARPQGTQSLAQRQSRREERRRQRSDGARRVVNLKLHPDFRL